MSEKTSTLTHSRGGSVAPLFSGNGEAHELASLRLRLDLYDDMIMLSQYKAGVPTFSYPVSPIDAAVAIGNIGTGSPVLSPGVIFWGYKEGAERVGYYLPPRLYILTVAGYGECLRVPLPGLVVVGHETNYQIFAVVGDAWPGPGRRLYRAPMPNVGLSAICSGAAIFPVASGGAGVAFARAFFGAEFNSHSEGGKSKRCPRSILRMWRFLDKVGAVQYPVWDMEPLDMTVGGLV